MGDEFDAGGVDGVGDEGGVIVEEGGASTVREDVGHAVFVGVVDPPCDEDCGRGSPGLIASNCAESGGRRRGEMVDCIGEECGEGGDERGEGGEDGSVGGCGDRSADAGVEVGAEGDEVGLDVGAGCARRSSSGSGVG